MTTADQDEIFRTELTALIPHMRAFARSLCGRADLADDLAQDALLKAWNGRASYEPGTNLKAWVFTITRNQFYSDKRRSWREAQLDPDVAESRLLARSDPDSTLALDEVRRALAALPEDQREALILIGAGGLSYEEVAGMTGCAVGTVKSRVSRARDRLTQLVLAGAAERDGVRPSAAMADILAQLDVLSRSAA
jgi:RNA polymerase sigma-70 factor (ECF subfamily)